MKRWKMNVSGEFQFDLSVDADSYEDAVGQFEKKALRKMGVLEKAMGKKGYIGRTSNSVNVLSND